jgi:DNA-binding transcriptional regulator PaaX
MRTKMSFGRLGRTLLIVLSATPASGLQLTNARLFREAKTQIANLSEDRFREGVRRLCRAGLVRRSGNGEVCEVSISEKGISLAVSRALVGRETSPVSIGKWDGRWRVVCFDLPEIIRSRRRMLRDALVRIGFFQIQRSVFVHPTAPKSCVSPVVTALAIERFVTFLVAEKMDSDAVARNFFHL